jgi:hypothetical protein
MWLRFGSLVRPDARRHGKARHGNGTARQGGAPSLFDDERRNAMSSKHTEEASEPDANKYRLMQAKRLLKIFEEAHGYPAQSVEALSAWITSPEGRKALAPRGGSDGKIIP